jgi:non-ribosomal peptide synthetase component F
MALLAALDLLLHRLTGEDDIVVGTAIANRERIELEGLIGCFANTLALRVELSGRPTFRALFERVRRVSLAAYAHQDLPFERLVSELAPERDLGWAPRWRGARPPPPRGCSSRPARSTPRPPSSI